MLPKGVDLVVIGAGIVGCSCAYMAARRGARVLLLDKEGGVAREGSGRALGSLRVQGRQPPEVPFALRSRDIWIDEGRTGNFELVMDGNIYLCEDEKERGHLEKLVETAHAQGLEEVQLLNLEQTRLVLPEAAGEFSCAMYSPVDGHCQPAKATMHFAQKAARAGVRVEYKTKVVRLVERSGRIGAVETESGSVETDRVVLASGVWSPHLAHTIGLELPVMPVVLHMCETSPMQPLFSQSLRAFGFSGRQRPNGRVVLGAGLNARVDHYLSFGDFRDLPMWLPRLRHFRRDVRLRMSVGQLAEQLSAGSPLSPRAIKVGAREPRVDSSQMDRALVSMSRVIPTMRSASISRYWGGLIDMSPDGLPILDAEAGPEGLVVVAGLSGHGLAIGPALGEAATDLALTGATDYDTSAFWLSRFRQKRVPIPEKII